MQFLQRLVARQASARRVLAVAAALFAVQLGACSSDSPNPVSPAAVNGVKPSAQVLDLSAGPVTALIKSAWLDTKCVTVRNGLMANGTQTELRPCTGSAAQQFTFSADSLVRIGSTYCLDATPGTGLPGDKVIIWNCHGRANQEWRLTSSNQIKGINGLCITFSGHPDDGAALYIDKCNSGSSQGWTETVTSTPTTPSAPSVASVAVSLSRTAIVVGDTTRAAAVLKDANGNVLTGQTVSWTSSSPSVATVTAAGLITAVAAGSTNIVATNGSISGSATLTVTATTTVPPSTGGASCSLVTGTASRAQSAFAKPGYLQPAIEPDFGTTIIRISGDPGTPIGNGISGTWPSVVYHNYPKDPVWSADQKLMVLKHGFPNSAALFLDGTTYQPLFLRGGPANGGGEWRMHPTLPDVAVALGTNGAVSHWNVRTNVTTTKVPAVAGYTDNYLGPWEGNVSRDGRYLVAKATRTSDGHTVARVIDVDGGSTGVVIDLTATGVFANLDWVSVSAGGGYVVAYDGSSHRTRVWSRATGAQVGDWGDYTFGHYDLGFDGAGNETAFGAVGQSPYSHHYIARRLDSGAITDLTGAVTSYNWHAGTRGAAGWGYAATNDRTGYPLDGEIYAVKLDGSQTIQRWAHHRASNASYERSAFPTASPDGKRIIFASDWQQGTGPLQAYVVDIRPRCP